MAKASSTDNPTDSTCELDSHADTCCAGANTLKIHDEGRTVNVHAYAGDYEPISDISVATVATLWTDPKDGSPYILIIHEALYFGDRLAESLLNPNQLRANGLVVEDVPRQFDNNSSHSIVIPQSGITIPLSMQGVVSLFHTSKPTWEEYYEHPHIELTSSLPWSPNSSEFAEKEESFVARVDTLDERAKLEDQAIFEAGNLDRHINAVYSLECSRELVETHDDMDDLGNRLVSMINVAADDAAGDGLDGYGDETLYTSSEECRTIRGLSTSDKKSVLTAQVLANRWHIGLNTASRTMNVTTQSGIRNVLAPSERKLRQRLDHMRFPNLRGKWYTDTWFATVKSLRGYKANQLFTNGKGYDRPYPMVSKKDAPNGLMGFIHDVGIPQIIVSDNAQEEIRSEWGATCRKYRIKQEQTVPYCKWRNLAEASVRECKVGVRRATRRKGSPKRLWCYLVDWVCAIRRLTALDIKQLNGRSPTEDVLGSTPDISAYSMFDWYEPVWFYEPEAKFPYEKKCLGMWIGVEEASVDLMAFRILKDTGKPIVRKSVWAVSHDELATTEVQEAIARLKEAILQKLGDTLKDTEVDPEIMGCLPEVPEYLFDEEEDTVDPEDPDATKPEADDFTPEAYDQYLTAEVMLPHGGEMAQARVISRKRDADGNLIGTRNPNPILDTRLYEVEYPDGSTEAVTANLIAENLYAQVDEEGRSFAILGDIVDHRTNGHALSKDDGFEISSNGQRRPRRTTRGWELQVEWKDGSTDWVPLKDLKESNPVELAEYAVANKIVEEPAFAWWVRQVLRRRDRIIKKVKSRYWKKTHKYGIELPKTVERALKIDDETGTDFWRRAIEKEMKNVMPAFEFRDNDKIPDFYKKIDCHMVFDVKIGDLTRKARFVAGGHMTDPPKDSTYSSVVSRDSVRIAFLVAALNDLDVLAADVQNAYLNAPTKEKVYTIAGLEFGPQNVGRPVLIVRALYGLKSSGARWRDHMAASLREAGFESCKADPDVWMKAEVKPTGEKYWAYVLCYVDDLLVISHNPKEVMEFLASKYTLKEGSVKEPDMYLGNEVKKWYIDDSLDPEKPRWAMSSDLYVKRAVAEVELELGHVGQRLSTKVSTPMSAGYRPEVDGTKPLDDRRASYYQGLIGVLRWICELGRIDILIDVAMLSRFLAAPREGHLEQVFHIFAYLKKHGRSAIVFDDTLPEIDENRFQKCDWEEFYPGAREVTPPNAPELRGNTMKMSCFVDADHAGCRVTRRSHTGILLFLNRAPIMWYSKRQNTVETSTFGSEFIALKTAIEMIEGLRYKLRMMGIEVDGSTDVFCDNESVVKNSTRPESALKKKHNAISYHRVREAQAAGIVRIAHEDGDTNLADLLTKCLAAPRLKELISHVLW